MLEPDGPFMPLGAWFAKPEQIAGSDLEDIASISPTGRVLVLDIASDKELLIARISGLIDRERKAAGIAPVSRRGPTSRTDKKRAVMPLIQARAHDHARQAVGLPPGPPYPDFDWEPKPEVTEYGEFLRSLREFHVVPLWDLQLAGRANSKSATARVLFPEEANRDAKTENVVARSIPRGLLTKINRAMELQDQVAAWVPRLRATVG
jgi:hypothetical protein